MTWDPQIVFETTIRPLHAPGPATTTQSRLQTCKRNHTNKHTKHVSTLIQPLFNPYAVDSKQHIANSHPSSSSRRTRSDDRYFTKHATAAGLRSLLQNQAHANISVAETREDIEKPRDGYI